MVTHLFRVPAGARIALREQDDKGAKPGSAGYARRHRQRHNRIVGVVKVLVIIDAAGLLGFLGGRNVDVR